MSCICTWNEIKKKKKNKKNFLSICYFRRIASSLYFKIPSFYSSLATLFTTSISYLVSTSEIPRLFRSFNEGV